MKLKIIHLGDIQIEIKTSGAMAQRLAEYQFVLNQKTVDLIRSEQPDIVYIAGDVYQNYDANGDETKLFGQFIQAILPHCKGIRIIPGNHDIKQRNNVILEDAQERMSIDCIESVISNIQSTKIEYYKHTGFYLDAQFDITWGVWSQIDKHFQKPYSPWELEPDFHQSSNSLIELYHDPYRGCIGFDGVAQSGTEDCNFDLSMFKAKTILAGDIHMPQTRKTGDTIFTYCSSLVQRNFGEGNVYSDSHLKVNGNDKHGLNIIQFDTDKDIVTDIKFVPIKPNVGRHTIHLSKDFNYDLIDSLAIEKNLYDKVKLIVHGNVEAFVANHERIVQHLSSDTTDIVKVEFTANAASSLSVEQMKSIDDLIGREKIIELGNRYIEDVVNRTKTVSDDMKAKAKELFAKIFVQELDNVDLTSISTNINIQSALISNFMTFGKDIEIDFPNIPITRILGSNGVGKTTLFYFIAWMFTDFVSSTQSARFKKQNYLNYFNDRLESDTVEGSIKFSINGNLHVLTKSIERSWKKGEAKYGDENWRESIAGVNASMILKTPDLETTDTVKILEYMSDILNFDEFSRIMFFNQTTLDALIQQKPEDLNQRILRNIGLNFFDRMLSRYDDMKTELLSNVVKPTSTVEEIVKVSKTNEELIPQYEQSIIDTNNVIQSIEKEIKKNTLQQSELTKKLHNVGTIESIDQSIESNTSLQNDCTEQAKKLSEELVSNQKLLLTANNENDKITKSIQDKNIERERINGSIALLNQSIENKQTDINNRTNNLKNLFELAKSKSLAKLKDFETELINHEQTIKQYEIDQANRLTAFEQCKSQLASNIQKLIDENTSNISTNNTELIRLNAEKSAIDSKIMILETDISNVQQEIVTLKDSKTCKACNREHNTETLQQIQISVTNRTHTEAKKSDELKEVKAKLTVLIQSISDIEDINQQLATKRTELDSKLLDIQNKTIDSNILPSELQTITNTYKEIANDLISKRKQHELDRTALDEKKLKAIEDAKSDESIQKEATAIKALTDDINSIRLDVETKEQDIKTIDANILELNKLIINIESLNKTIADTSLAINNNKIDLDRLKQSRILLDANRIKASEDIETNKAIQRLVNSNTMANDSIRSKQLDIHTFNSNIQKATETIERCLIDIENIKKYHLHDSIAKLYKRLVSKNGLPQYIFQHVIPILNGKLNDLLDGMLFRLYFDENDLCLKMIDLTKNIVRPITFASGAETTFLGLALVSAIQQINIAKRTNLMLIDELSGKLNEGSNLPYNAPNYQQEFVRILKRVANDVNVLIVDHVIEDISENRTITVEKTLGGSIFHF